MKTSLKCSLILMLAALVFVGRSLAAEHTVYMESYGFFNFRFNPNYLEIDVDDTVTWVNNDYTQFGYMGYDAALYQDGQLVAYTGVLEPTDRVSITFWYAGSFTFEDTEYGQYGMTGSIVVREPVGTALPPVFVNPQRLLNGQFSCTISNLVIGTTNVVLAADSPAAAPENWSIVASNIVVSTEQPFTDAPLGQRRFYRALRP